MKKNIPVWLIVHHVGGTEANPHADTSGATFAEVNEWHEHNPLISLGIPSSLGFYIGYHYFIDKQGVVTQGRADTDEGAHCKGMNTTSLGICLAGNFDVTYPTKAQTDSLRKLLSEKSQQYGISHDHIVPHRRFSSKTCYGTNLDGSWASDLVTGDADPRIPILLQLVAMYKQLIEKLRFSGCNYS
jgi:hypothetical protein